MYIQQYRNRNWKLGIVVTLFVLMVLALSACSSTNNDKTVEDTTKSSDVKKSKTTKTISTINGEIEIPTQPKRIVAEEYLGSLIALDVIPVGAPELTLKNYYFKDKLKGVSDTGVYGKPSAENILAMNPDLIITGNNESYKILSKIAPTIVIPYGDLKNAHEELTYFGELLNKVDEAKVWLEKYDQQIADAKAKVDAAIKEDSSFSIMEDAGKVTYVYGDNFGRGGQAVYQAFGRKPPKSIAEEIMKKQWAELSEEMIPEYAGDYIIMTSNGRTVEDFKKDPIWGSLEAVKNDRLYIWPEERSWYYDPIATLAQVQELTNWLTNLKQ
ncbi:ABC transporter substrate-binding protein [Viridibacillus sp. FSL R5-0468]|uniref:ABC transporter substrate-binding protein n=1 Tax=Viridibacillus sp. FSL R5-0468 TaxID=2921640 RepID=UPI0030F9DE47